MARKVRHALHDILEAIERVETITHDKTLAQFEGSWELRWLMQRAIEIISEASRAIPAELTSTHPEIPWSQVRGIGNVLRHEYQGLSDPIIWKVGRCRGHYGELSGASGSERSALVWVKSTAWMICLGRDIVICPDFTRSASVSCRAGTGVACAQRSLLALGCVALGTFTQCAVVR
jgi:uncharacterized protein with HEPN domain